MEALNKKEYKSWELKTICTGHCFSENGCRYETLLSEQDIKFEMYEDQTFFYFECPFCLEKTWINFENVPYYVQKIAIENYRAENPFKTKFSR